MHKRVMKYPNPTPEKMVNKQNLLRQKVDMMISLLSLI